MTVSMDTLSEPDPEPPGLDPGPGRDHKAGRPHFRPALLLFLGGTLMIFTDMRGGAGLLAWLAPVPFLLHAASFRGWKDRGWLLLVLLVAFNLLFAKQVSTPVVYSLPFGVAIATLTAVKFFLTYMAWGTIRRWGGDLAGLLAFPALLVILEYLQAFHTPFGVWGSLAHTQVYNLPLLQTASLLGFLGLTALIAWGAALFASLILDGTPQRKGVQLILFSAVAAGLLVYGDIRLDRTAQGESIRASAVVSDLQPPTGLPRPSDPAIREETEEMLRRTARAAELGASFVVWSEAATLVSPQREPAFLDRVAAVAREQGVSVVAAYGVIPPAVEGHGDSKFENKYVWLRPDGTVAETYYKHHPVPGEGSVPGTAPLRAIETADGRMAGAICYDYDFPRMAQTHAELDAGMVVLPGLDWRGMRRRHSFMARVRAIEGGFSLLRSVNDAVSLGVDGYGHIRASRSDFAANDHIMIAQLPVGRVHTVYSRIGNVIVYAALAGLLFALGVAIRGYTARKGPSRARGGG